MSATQGNDDEGTPQVEPEAKAQEGPAEVDPVEEAHQQQELAGEMEAQQKAATQEGAQE